MSRSFTICEINDRAVSDGGRFLSNTPSGAARKAGNRVMRKRNVNSVKVCVRELTRGGLGKEYSYRVKRVRVNEEVMRGDVAVLYEFKTMVKSLKH
jgi:hypothetical protein